jgi:hypothetical protein
MSTGPRLTQALGLAGLGLLAACGSSDDGPGTGGVSVEEAEALDQAAEMLDSQRLPPEALEEVADQPGTDLAPGAPNGGAAADSDAQ